MLWTSCWNTRVPSCEARTYAFRRDPASLPHARDVVLRWDRQRDREAAGPASCAAREGIRGHLGPRPSFAQFFEEVSQGDEESMPCLHMDRDDGSPYAESRIGDFRRDETGEDTRGALEGLSRARYPSRGCSARRVTRARGRDPTAG